MRRFGATLAALVVATTLGSCGDDPPPNPPPRQPSGLVELARQAERWAMRAETLLNRGWAPRLEFRQRLFGRVQALRSFVQEATAAASSPGTPPERLLERGHKLIGQAKPFDDALSLLEGVAGTLDQLTAYERMIGLNMQPLETRGEAPYRIRVTDYGKQVAAGFSNLDLALRGILDQAGDVKLFENIATKGLSDALATATKLSEEVKNSGHAAAAVVDRQKHVHERITWAEGVAAKVGGTLPAEAAQALADARKFAKEEMDAASSEVLESLRNAQPDALDKANALAARIEPLIERLTKAFLQIGRAASLPDPK